MNTTSTENQTYDQRARRDSLAIVGWIFTWMLSLIISDKAALYGWWSTEWVTWLSIVINAALGLWVVRSYMRMLKNLDELQRQIQLNALAVSLGVSLVGSITYSLLVTWGYITDEEVSDIFVLMCVSYSAAVLYGQFRYR
jgi:hypothetical protein